MNKPIVFALLAAAMTACGPQVPQLGRASIDEVVEAMTLEEKAHLVVGTGMAGFSGENAVVGETRKLVPGAAGTTYPIERLGIPSVVLADGPAGLRINPTREGDSQTYYCTHFPIGTLLASTWDQELVEKVGEAIGNEVLEYGTDVLLAPALNIHRNPLCGRNFEYYSEDPVVSGKIAAAYVRGVQNNGVGTSVKHFALNNQETNRMANDAHVSQRALREIYLKGFEIVVRESDPWTVMSSYNYLNGIYTSENPELQTAMLRDEWGFRGMVMTDWFGGKDAVAQMVAGNDMLQPGTDKQYEMIVSGVKEGRLDEAVLDRNVKRILEMILRTPRFQGYCFSNKPDLEAHAAVTRQSATEGMVLLKNENEALPLSAGTKRIALLGCTSYDFIAGGTGSGNVNRAYTVSLLDGLKQAGYELDGELKTAYEQHIAAENERNRPDTTNRFAMFLPRPRPTEMMIPAARLQALAKANDVALITLGRTSGEFLDRKKADFELTREEKALLNDVCRAFHAAGKKVVVVLNIGGVIETASWKNRPDAILCAWQAGQEGGNSVADVRQGFAQRQADDDFPRALCGCGFFGQLPHRHGGQHGHLQQRRKEKQPEERGLYRLRGGHLRGLSLFRHVRQGSLLPLRLRSVLHDVRVCRSARGNDGGCLPRERTDYQHGQTGRQGSCAALCCGARPGDGEQARKGTQGFRQNPRTPARRNRNPRAETAESQPGVVRHGFFGLGRDSGQL
jgi:beta-glucosidase